MYELEVMLVVPEKVVEYMSYFVGMRIGRKPTKKQVDILIATVLQGWAEHMPTLIKLKEGLKEGS